MKNEGNDNDWRIFQSSLLLLRYNICPFIGHLIQIQIQTNRSRWATMFPRRFAKYEFRNPPHKHWAFALLAKFGSDFRSLRNRRC